MRQVSAMRQIHAQDLIAVLDRREIDGHVRLRAAVRLHIRMIRAEQLLRAIDRRLLDYICPFTAAVVAFAGIAFGIFVGEDGAGRFEHGFANKVFAGDQFKAVSLARDFVVNGAGDQWIGFSKR